MQGELLLPYCEADAHRLMLRSGIGHFSSICMTFLITSFQKLTASTGCNCLVHVVRIQVDITR